MISVFSRCGQAKCLAASFSEEHLDSSITFYSQPFKQGLCSKHFGRGVRCSKRCPTPDHKAAAAEGDRIPRNPQQEGISG